MISFWNFKKTFLSADTELRKRIRLFTLQNRIANSIIYHSNRYSTLILQIVRQSHTCRTCPGAQPIIFMYLSTTTSWRPIFGGLCLPQKRARLLQETHGWRSCRNASQRKTNTPHWDVISIIHIQCRYSKINVKDYGRQTQ